jgi:hypothetical protein
MTGISYFTISSAPGRYFNCEAQRCMLSESSCASQFNRAKGGTSKCSDCKVGAEHAGEAIDYSFPEKMCCRCGETDKRLIGKRVCVSCYNREREYLSGRNAKGKFPVNAKPIKLIDVFVTGIGGLSILAANAAEAMAIIIRETPSASVHPMRHPVHVMQLRLF